MVVRGVVIMLDITEMKKLLKASLPHKRFKHSLAVYDTALELAAVLTGYGCAGCRCQIQR